MEVLLITGGTINFKDITQVLCDSIDEFSKHSIVVYGINQSLDISSKKVFNKIVQGPEVKPQLWYMKQNICLQALLDFPDVNNFIWLDGDIVIRSNFDDLDKEFERLTNYPVINSHYLNQYYILSEDKIKNYFNQYLIETFGIQRVGKTLGFANLFLFNHRCHWFFEELLDLAKQLDEAGKLENVTWNDEGLDNLLRWKYRLMDGFLPPSDFETGFNPQFFDRFYTEDGPTDFGIPLGWNQLPVNKNQIKIFHGCKDVIRAKQILSNIKQMEQNNVSKGLLNLENEYKDFSSLNIKEPTLRDVAVKYGWDAAIWYEINILHDYDYIPDISIPQGLVVDIGANLGYFSDYAKRNGATRILAFEPDPRYFEVLRKNCPYAELFECAISDSNKEGVLHLKNHLGGSCLIDGPETIDKVQVNCFSLNHFFEAELFIEIDLLKIDIEGSEIDLFNGLSDNNLQKIKKLTIEFHTSFWPDGVTKRDNLLTRFKNLGFKTYSLHMGKDDLMQMLYAWR